MKKRGPRTEPWDTPEGTAVGWDVEVEWSGSECRLRDRI